MQRNLELLISWKEVLSKLLLTNAKWGSLELLNWVHHCVEHAVHAAYSYRKRINVCLLSLSGIIYLAKEQYRASERARPPAHYYRFIAIQFELSLISVDSLFVYNIAFTCRRHCGICALHVSHVGLSQFDQIANEWECTVQWKWTKESGDGEEKLDSQQNRLTNNFIWLESRVIMLNVAYKLFGKLKRIEKNNIGDILWLVKLHLNTYCGDIVAEMRNIFLLLPKELIVFVLRDVKNSNRKESRKESGKGQRGRESE